MGIYAYVTDTNEYMELLGKLLFKTVDMIVMRKL